MAAYLPLFYDQQFLANTGSLGSSYLLYTYEDGTTTPKATYTDATGGTANPNPVPLNSAGRPSSAVFLGSGSYSFELKTDAGVLVKRWDSVASAGGLVDTITTQLAASNAANVGAGMSGYLYTNNYTSRTVGAKLNAICVHAVADLLCDPTGVEDCRAKIQAALDAGLTVTMGYGIFALSGELVIKDGTGIIGARPFFKRRTGYAYGAKTATVFKYTGPGGLNSCVIRASETAVGTVGSDFTTPSTDDLLAITCRDFHIDCNGAAEYGLYGYRCGNDSQMQDITCEKATKANIVFLGCYAAPFGTFGCYEGGIEGCIVGWDIFGWGSVEATCFAMTGKFLTANNGTLGTYVAGSGTDLEGSGGRFSVGRGSNIEITAESNDGRACVLSQYNIATGTGGPTDYTLRYIEGNDTGPYIDYRDGMDGIRIGIGFLHPGNGGALHAQSIKIDGKNNSGVTTTDSGPANRFEWLVIERAFGDLAGVGVDIDSNTGKYVMRDLPIEKVTFSNKKPLTDDFIPTDRQVTASAYFSADASPTIFNQVNGTLTRAAAGTYTFTFTRAFRTAGQHTPIVSVVLSAALNTSVRCTSIGVNSVTIVTYNSGGAAADTGDRIGFMMSGMLT